MGYKQSRYNFFFDAEDRTHFAFNAMSGGLAKIKDENYDEIQKILQEPNKYKADTDGKKKLWKSLMKGMFLIKDEIDEIALLKYRNRVGRFNSTNFFLVIMPTLQCNFRCVYCYETHPNLYLTLKKEENIVKLVEKRLSQNRYKSFVVKWFGGEPLLKVESILRLSSIFRKICKENQCHYSATLCTNGYLLNKAIIKELEKIDVKMVQITLDGPQKFHDKHRILANGNGTFDKIFSNLITLAELTSPQKLRIIIRVNYDKESLPHIPELFDIFPERLKTRAEFYFRRISYPLNSCFGIYEQETISPPSLLLESAKLSREVLKHGGRLPPLAGATSIGKPGYCDADYFNHFVIGPQGSIYKCTGAIERKDKIGHLDDRGQLNLNIAKLAKWVSSDPFEDKICISCKVLPLCMGECTYNRVFGNATKDKCLYKDVLIREIKLRYCNSNYTKKE